jgi:hypothetical protein
METVFKFYNAKVMPVLCCGSECWTLAKEQMNRMKTAEMYFLRAVMRCHLSDKKLNEGIRKELHVLPNKMVGMCGKESQKSFPNVIQQVKKIQEDCTQHRKINF